jgi:hypothetical protein
MSGGVFAHRFKLVTKRYEHISYIQIFILYALFQGIHRNYVRIPVVRISILKRELW